MTSRRDALRTLGNFAVLPFLGGFGASQLVELGRHVRETAAARRSTGSAPRVLSDAQYELVRSAAERILPRTATPGATDAGVVAFVDAMLADWYGPDDRARFIVGLDALERAAARGSTGRAFILHSEQRQAELLDSVDVEVESLRRSRPADADRHWFAMLKFLTVWGFYTSRVGMVEELKVDMVGGRYEPNASYSPPGDGN